MLIKIVIIKILFKNLCERHCLKIFNASKDIIAPVTGKYKTKKPTPKYISPEASQAYKSIFGTERIIKVAVVNLYILQSHFVK